jgi:hypothetical protein
MKEQKNERRRMTRTGPAKKKRRKWRNWAWAQLIWTPKAQLLFTPILAQVQAQSLWAFTIYCSKAQSDLGPEKSKAQLKWAPATSKNQVPR